MRISLLTNAILYFVLGMVFIFLAIRTTSDTVWNVSTILLALIATFDIGLGVRFARAHFRVKNKKE